MLAGLENWWRTPPAFLPVDPAASCGSRSSNTTSVIPCWARCHATLHPMHPPPTITTSAVVLKLNLLQFYGLRKFPLVPTKNTLILLTEGSCPILLSVS